MITIKLLDSEKDIQKKINKASSEVINSKISSKFNRIEPQVSSIVRESILSQPEINSLQQGVLKGAFGLVSDPTSAIVNAVDQSISVSFNKYNQNLRGGGLEVSVQPSSFVNLISISQSYIPDGTSLMNWMEWLLLMGDSVIIANYQYDPVRGKGRSNLGIMKEGSFFRVPPEFSGTEYNNFITRALDNDNVTKNISIIFEGMFK